MEYYSINLAGDKYTREQALEWLKTPDNAYKCKHCPEATHRSPGVDQYPCGQYRCWVCAHCGKSDFFGRVPSSDALDELSRSEM